MSLKKEFENASLKGKVVVFTGKMSQKRRQMHGITHEVGAIPATKVTELTDFVVAGKKAGSNLQAAADLSVRILSEEDFFELVQKERAAKKAAKATPAAK